MRRFSHLFLVAPLVLGLAHCAVESTESSAREPSGEEEESDDRGDAEPDDDVEARVDASVPARDAGARVDASTPARDASVRLDAGTPPKDGGARADASVPSLDGGPRVDASAPSQDAGTPSSFVLTSSVVKEGERIANDYRCSVDSPPLSWSAGPPETKSYALVFKDQGNGFTHWVIYDIPANELGLPKGVPVAASPVQPAGAKQVPNWSGRAGYGGPCGGMSTYAFTLYALDVASLPGIAAGVPAAQVIRAIEEHDLASARLTITSSR